MGPIRGEELLKSLFWAAGLIINLNTNPFKHRPVQVKTPTDPFFEADLRLSADEPIAPQNILTAHHAANNIDVELRSAIRENTTKNGQVLGG